MPQASDCRETLSRHHRTPPPTTANLIGIGDSLTRVAGSMAPRRARGVRNGCRVANSVQSGAVMAHLSRQFGSNTSRAPPTFRPANGEGRNLSDRSKNRGEQSLRNRFFGHLNLDTRHGAWPTTFAPIPIVAGQRSHTRLEHESERLPRRMGRRTYQRLGTSAVLR